MSFNHKVFQDTLSARSLTQDDLARRIIIEPAKLAEALRDADGFSTAIVNKIADELSVPEFIFYMSRSPHIDQGLIDFRSSHPKRSAKTKKTVDTIQWVRELQKFLDRSLLERKVMMPVLTKNANDIESQANHIREVLDVSIADQILAKDTHSFYNLCRKKIEDRGILVFQDSFPEIDGSGLCLVDKHFPIIVVNTKKQTHGRRLFTLIHELAHVLRGESGVSDPSNAHNELERSCNRFAASFLLPGKSVKELLRGRNVSSRPDRDEISSITKQLKVSQELAVLRLEELEYFSLGTYNRWKALFENSSNPDFGTGNSGGGPVPQEKVKYARFGQGLAKALTELLHDKKVDPIGIYRLVGLKPKYQKSYFDFAASLTDEAARTLELGDE